MGGYKVSGGENRDRAPRAKSQEVAVAADNRTSPGNESCLKHSVVVRISCDNRQRRAGCHTGETLPDQLHYGIDLLWCEPKLAALQNLAKLVQERRTGEGFNTSLRDGRKDRA